MTARHDVLGPRETPRAVTKAVILAAGRGRRMGARTHDRPKAALALDGKALIDWQIAALRLAGVRDIAVVTGHAPEALAGRDVHYIHNRDWTAGTQVDSLLRARDWVGRDPVIISYGDIVFHPCAVRALLERPGDIILSYDADHRWLWRERSGDWLKDSETFRLGPGQVLTEIGARPRTIEEVEGQFIGLFLLTPEGLQRLGDRHGALNASERDRTDFTGLLGSMVRQGVRVDTAVNLQAWMEIDTPRDLRLATRLCTPDEARLRPARLRFPTAEPFADADETWWSPNDPIAGPTPGAPGDRTPDIVGAAGAAPPRPERTSARRIGKALAVANWGRSGSTLVQSLLDHHPHVLSTPNFYSRHYYEAWARFFSVLGPDDTIDAVMRVSRAWWDSGYVDATAGLHQLGEHHDQCAGVARDALEAALRAELAGDRPLTRRRLVEAAHLAYATALGRDLAEGPLTLVFPIHGESRGVACALLEDFPETQFVHTLRAPAGNMESMLKHFRAQNLDRRGPPLAGAARILLLAQSSNGRGVRTTFFGDRPYLAYLGETDQARALRFEDVKAAPAEAMKGLARWAQLPWEDGLADSTWDGKRCWNRPESRRPRGAGGPSCERLTAFDRSRLAWLCDPKARALGYAGAPIRSGPGAWLAWPLVAASLWAPWGRSARRTPSALRPLLLARRIASLFRREEAVAGALKRESLRAAREEVLDGATLVRRSTTPERRHHPVRALLVLKETDEGLRTQILKAPVRSFDLNTRDHIDVAFAHEIWSDEPPPGVSAAGRVFWALGRAMAPLADAWALRQTLITALIAPAPRGWSDRLPLIAREGSPSTRPHHRPPSARDAAAIAEETR